MVKLYNISYIFLKTKSMNVKKNRIKKDLKSGYDKRENSTFLGYTFL